MNAHAVMPVGIVIERRKSDHPWQDVTWHAIGVLPRYVPSANERWKLLAEGDDWAQFHAGSLQLELFRADTEGYRVNLSQNSPAVYIVLRRGEEADEKEVEPFLVTVCPYEATCYDNGADQFVDAVPMPSEILAWLGEFVERYHVDVPFRKRRNRRAEDSGHSPPSRGDGPQGMT